MSSFSTIAHTHYFGPLFGTPTVSIYNVTLALKNVVQATQFNGGIKMAQASQIASTVVFSSYQNVSISCTGRSGELRKVTRG